MGRLERQLVADLDDHHAPRHDLAGGPAVEQLKRDVAVIQVMVAINIALNLVALLKACGVL